MLSIGQIEDYIRHDGAGIPGWFFRDDMLYFYYVGLAQIDLGVAGSVCELGVFEGKSLVLLGMIKRESEDLIGIDKFDQREKNTVIENLGKYDLVAELFQANTTKCTLEWARDFFLRPVRFLHIDAGHDFFEVYRDLLLFSRVVADAGVIVLDDYNDREFPGIEAAVYEFCRHDGRYVPFLIGYNKIFLCGRGVVGLYQKKLMAAPPFSSDVRICRLFDHPVLIPNSKHGISRDFILEEIDKGSIPARYKTLTQDLDELSDLADKYGQFGYR